MKNLLSIIILIASINIKVQAQVSPDKVANTPTKSDLSYEALSQFFQSSVTSGKNGGFDFKATGFGIKKLFSKKNLDISDYYLSKTNKAARNFEVSFGVHKGTNGELNTLLGGFKYAIINNRSKSDENFTDYPQLNTDLQNTNNVRNSAQQLYQNEIDEIKNDEKTKKNLQDQFDLSLHNYNSSQNIKDLPVRVQAIIDSIINKNYGISTSDFFNAPQKTYDNIAKKIDTKGLLTLSFNPGYSWNNARFDSTTISLRYLAGLVKKTGNYNKPWNLDGQLNVSFLHDTTGLKKNLSRTLGVGSIGVNKIFLNDEKLNPIIEFELAFEDDYILNRTYKNEDQNKITLNTILRVHLSKEISLPITLKYDLKNPNLLGFFKIDWNLETNKNNK